MVPAGRRLAGPMVRRQRHGPVEPLAEVGDDLLARPSEADDADVGLHGDGIFDVGQVKRAHVAQQPRPSVQSEAGETLPHHPPPLGMSPAQQRRLLEGADRIGLLAEDLGQRRGAAPAGADTEDDRLCHQKERRDPRRKAAEPDLRSPKAPRQLHQFPRTGERLQGPLPPAFLPLASIIR